MGVAIPQIITEDRASGALVVDGGLRFDSSKSHRLARTPGSAGNQKTWTWSGWVKRSNLGTNQLLFGSSTLWTELFFNTSNQLQFYAEGGSVPGGGLYLYSNAVFRDLSAWMHIVWVVDTTQPTTSDRIKVYTNGVQLTWTSSLSFNQNLDLNVNSTNIHGIGSRIAESNLYLNGCLTNIHFIDGQALDASYFGYTDPLTNTWRPKKLSSSVAFGTNGFYLPFDGSAPIGQDQSGRGNNWTPVNFGGSNTLEKATGALPILNTDGGGKVARVGVRTDSSASSLVLALPLVGIKSDFSNAVNSGTSNKAITANGNAAASSVQSNFYGGSFYFDGNGDYLITDSASADFVCNVDFTIEMWYRPGNTGIDQTLWDQRKTASSNVSSWSLVVTSTNTFTVSFGPGPQLSLTSNTAVNTSTWYHVAVCRQGSNCYLFVNGILEASGSNSYSDSSNIQPVIGGRYNFSGDWTNGYIQDVRYYKGLAKYTQNFIPASTDPDILPDTPSGVSYTSNLTQITDGAVAFDGSGDWLTLSGSNDFVFGAPSGSSNDFTIEGFFYLSSFSASYYVLGGVWTTGSATEEWLIQIQNNGDMRFLTTVGTSFYSANISAGRWYHFAAVRSSSTITLYVNGVSVGSYTNSNSIGSSSKTVYFGTQNGGTWDWNGFISNLHIIKGTALYTSNFTPPSAPITSVANTKLLCCKSNASAGAATSSPNISGSINNGTVWSSTTNTSLIYGGSASMIFDGNATWSVGNYANFNPGAFTLFSGANVTANTSIRVYANFAASDSFKINGATYTDNANGSEQWIVPSGVTYPITVNSIVIDTTGGSQNTISAVEIDGTILTDPVIVYGNAAATNFNPFTVNINTQRGKQSGWATFNPNQTKILGATDAPTLSDGNLTVAGTSSLTGNSVAGTIGVSSGKYYIEYTHLLNADANDTFGFGIRRDLFTGNYYDWEPYFRGTRIRATSDNGFYAAASGGSFSAITTIGDVIGIIFDIDNNYCAITVNGVIRVSSSSAGLSGYTWYPYAAGDGGGKVSANFGQKPFKFPPPAGFQPLALANTPRPTIVRPDQYVGVTTYTGTGAASRPVTNLGFKPDFVWIKNRSSGSYSHQLFDSVRGASAGCLYSDLTNAQDSNFPITSFDTSGFTLGSSASLASQSYASQNGSGSNYVGWAWKAGGNSNTYNINDVGYATASAAGLTAGTITPTGASVNTKSGFSIITYTGTGSAATISHGGLVNLSNGMIIVKNRSSATNWRVYHSAIGNTKAIFLSTTGGTDTSSVYWNNTSPTSTVFSVGSDDGANGNTNLMVAYCFTPVVGYSSFGSYVAGSGEPFIYLGFKPALVMIKAAVGRDTAYTSWYIADNKRPAYNPENLPLWANKSAQEGLRGNGSGVYSSDLNIDLLSNGFKIRDNNGAPDETNFTGATYIYAAFAETPTQNLYGAQANAR